MASEHCSPMTTTTSETDVDKGNDRSCQTDHGDHRWNRQALYGDQWEASAVPHLFWLFQLVCSG